LRRWTWNPEVLFQDRQPPAANFTNAREFPMIFREIRAIRGKKRDADMISDKV